ncbi:helix-turn-helix domain-containing protein [Rahnella variigena]|uniref:helix-turn-helix domain-containing protein n=1 Tax=Rahnella TaxID=34037 RepID=UPI000DD48A61
MPFLRITGRHLFYVENNTNERRYLLLYPNKPIASIAQDIGFDDHSYFATCFRREFGLPPRAFKSTAAGQFLLSR